MKRDKEKEQKLNKQKKSKDSDKKAAKSKKRARKKKDGSIMITTTVYVLCFVLIMIGFSFWQFYRMEKGVLDVCAAQQDAYVQLVIDQINLKENRDNEEIVTGILGTLDASSNKYWTFSHDQAMLFVKDVLETNKYKGFTTATYYNSASAQSFLDGLDINHVTHAEITVDEKRYLASGVKFDYGGEEYRLCLLTNRSVFLDNNSFLEAETQLLLIIAVILIVTMVVSMGMASRIRKLQKVNEENAVVIFQQNEGLMTLNAMLSDRNLHDSRNNLWNASMLHGFLEKLAQRDVDPVTLVRISFTKEKSQRRMLDRAKYMLDSNTLRFRIDDRTLIFVFVQVEPDDAKSDIRVIMPKDGVVEKVIMLEGGMPGVDKAERKLGISEGTENGR